MNFDKDFLMTTMSKSGKIVGYFASVKETAHKMQQAHKMNIISSAIFCRALCSTVLLGGNLKNKSDLLSVSWNCTGLVQKILVEVDYEGNVRGFIGNNNLDFIDGSIDDSGLKSEPYIGFGEIVVSRRSFNNSSPYNSVVVIETGEISQDITLYLEQSLQIQSVLNVGLSIDADNTIKSCGGIMLMGLPGVTDAQIKEMYDEYEKIGSIENILSSGSDKIIDFFKKIDMDIINQKNINFKCNCNLEKILKTLNSLNQDELKEFLNEDGVYEVTCHYCGKNYSISELNR